MQVIVHVSTALIPASLRGGGPIADGSGGDEESEDEEEMSGDGCCCGADETNPLLPTGVRAKRRRLTAEGKAVAAAMSSAAGADGMESGVGAAGAQAAPAAAATSGGGAFGPEQHARLLRTALFGGRPEPPPAPAPAPSALIEGYLVLLPPRTEQRTEQRAGGSGGAPELEARDVVPRVQLLTREEAATLLGLTPHSLNVELSLSLPSSLGSNKEVMRAVMGQLNEGGDATAAIEWVEQEEGAISHRSLRLAPNAAAGELRCSWDHSDEALASTCLPLLERWLAEQAA
jgi:hypothetical protein